MKVLVVEDQLKLVQFLKRGLTELGVIVMCVQTVAAADEEVHKDAFDVVVLDLMLPDRDGLDLLRKWRREKLNFPVLILSARNAVGDRVRGLERGADDYLPKPFSIEELHARIRALARRKATVLTDELHHRELTLNVTTRVVTLAGQPVELTARELALLEVFLRNAGRVVTRGMLVEQVWAMAYDVDSNLLEVYMSRLRTKLEGRTDKPIFETVRGMGYKMI